MITLEEQARSQELYDLMRDIGLPSMSTEELEEWSGLVAKSLEGKGDQLMK